MKNLKLKYLPAVIFLFCINGLKAQNYVQLYYNTDLQLQLAENQAFRLASEETIRSKYENMKNIYEKANEKLIQVVAVKQMITNTLTKVNEGLKQAKKVEYIFEDVKGLAGDLGKMLQMSAKYPQYALFTGKAYEQILKHGSEIQKLVSEQALKEDNSWLMDTEQRFAFLNEIHNEIKVMRAWCWYITSHLETAKYKPYWSHIGFLNNWVSQDRAIVNDIMLKWQIIKM